MDSVLELRKFVVPEIIVGLDARLLIGRYLSHFEAKRPLVVTGPHVRGMAWWQDIFNEICQVSDPVVFDEITPNPKDYEAMRGARLFVEQRCDLIVAIGGGSPMDCAKCIAIVSANGGNILDFEGVDEIRLPGPPLICIPSTAGTSADVSQFAIVQDSQKRVKKAIISKKIVPDLALIDPVPLSTMPAYLAACTGMDALTHAIEAYVSNASSALTDVHALEAVRLISDNLELSVDGGCSIEVLFNMMLGSIQAGMAFSNASLGAVHAMSHSLGGLLGLPHGECNSILLEHLIELNFAAAPRRFGGIARRLGVTTDGLTDEAVREHLLARIRNLRERVGIPAFFVLDVPAETVIDRLVDAAFADPCMVTNPRLLTREEVRMVYERVLRNQGQT